jgi:hypothetical protein
VNLLPEATRVVQTLDASNTKSVMSFLNFLKGRCWGIARNYIGVRAGDVPPRASAGSGVAFRDYPLGRGVRLHPNFCLVQ